MPPHIIGPRSQQFSGLPSTSSPLNTQTKRPREEFVDSRFKFTSRAAQSKKLTPSLSTIVSSHGTSALELEEKNPHECYFTSALQAALLNNLSIPFRTLHKTLEPITRSLPLLIHHQEEVVHTCCQALIVQDTQSFYDRFDPSSNTSESLGQSKKKKASQIEQDTKRRSIQARETVNLVAVTVLDLLVPLISDLSTSLLTPSTSPEKSSRCPFEELLTTLVYFINLTDVDPIALSKAPEVTVHLFKTLAKDLTPSSTEDQQSSGHSQRLERIWKLVRNALGAPFSKYEELIQSDNEPLYNNTSDVDPQEGLMDELDEDLIENDQKPDQLPIVENNVQFLNEDFDLLEYDETAQDGEPKVEESCSIQADSSPRPKTFHTDPILYQALRSTTPSSRRLVATSFGYLLRKKGISEYLIRLILDDLNMVELNELEQYGCLCARKEKFQVARKITGARSLLGEEQGSARVFAEGICMTLIETCKSVDSRLHSRTSVVISAIDTYLVERGLSESENAHQAPALASSVLSSLLTSVIHHTSTEHFEPILNSITTRKIQLLATLNSNLDSNKPVKGSLSLENLLQCLATVAGVRGGSRISTTQTLNLFKILDSVFDLISNAEFHPSSSLISLTSFFCLTLLSSITDNSEFLSAPLIRESLEKLLSPQNSPLPIGHVYQLASSLHRLNWPFFDHFFLPRLLTTITACLSSSDSPLTSAMTASLLADLISSRSPQLFSQVFDSITDTINEAVKVVLENLISFHATANSSSELHKSQTMSLEECYDWLSVCADLPVGCIAIDHARLEEWFHGALFAFESEDFNTEGAKQLRVKYISDYQSGRSINQTLLIYAIMNMTRRHCANEHSSLFSVVLNRVPLILHFWGWHRGILKFVRDLLKDAQSRFPVSLSYDSIYESLKPALLSESDVIRRLVLEILSTGSTSNSTLETLLKQCLKIEETSLLVENARIRQMHIRKLAIMAKSIVNPAANYNLVDMIQRILIAQLKVNFQPLWEESAKALTDLNEKHHANFWLLVWGQLELCLQDSPELYLIPQLQQNNILNENQSLSSITKFTDQSEFTCTNLQKLMNLFYISFENHTRMTAFENQFLDCRLDIHNYEAQLVNLLSRNHKVTEKHNKPIVDAFFSFCQAGDEDLEQGHLLGRSARSRLRYWLGMFSNFTNPKVFHRAKDLRGAFYDLLADPDPELRRLSLDCVLTWKDDGLLRHQDDLKNLLETSQFRDTLLKISHTFSEDAFPEIEREQVVPVVIRILFGWLLTFPGRSSASHNKTPKKSAILSAFKECSVHEIDLIVELMLRPLRASSSSQGNPTNKVKRQLGFLSLLSDVMKILGRQIVHRWQDLLDLIITIVTDSQSQLQIIPKDAASPQSFLENQLKKVCTQCLRRLNDFFQLSTSSFSFAKWIGPVFNILVNPKLPVFASQTAQAPSALLEIIHTWSSRRDLMPLLVHYNANLLNSVYQVLAIPNVKPPVVTKVMNVLENILHNIELFPQEFTADQYLTPYFDVLLPNLKELLRKASASSSLAASTSRQQITLLSSLAPYITGTTHSESFCQLILSLVLKNKAVVPEFVQADLLVLLSVFLSKAPTTASSTSSLNTLSKLLGTVSSRKGRLALVTAISSISLHPTSQISSKTVGLLQDLNSFSAKRIDDPDFEKRLSAFAQLAGGNDEFCSKLTPREWELLIQHSLFQIRDPDELGLRGGAASTICHFCDLAESNEDLEAQELLRKILIPSLKKLLRSKIEIIRQEVLAILSHAIAKEFSAVPELKELRCLLVGGDKEANFFLNIYHIQVHRRIRALKRLGDESEAGHLSSKVLLDFFLPLVVHMFLPNTSSKIDPDLINEAVRTIGRITQVLNWTAYHAVLQFYLKIILKPASVNKVLVRVIVSILKGFHFSLHAQPCRACPKNLVPAPEQACSFVSAKLVPTLINFMEQKKEDGPDESLRIMIAEGIAFVAIFLPENLSQNAISGIISSLSNILKSADQETRQSAKVTVGNITVLLPASFLTEVINTLKSILLRGPQLHILGHTIHVIISRIVESNQFKIEPDAAKFITSILIEDLFGQPWKDRQSKELRAKTKFNETKASRSLETLQMMISKLSDSETLVEILKSFGQLLETTRASKALKQVDECFHRICAGIVTNKEQFDAPKVLKLVHDLISHHADYLKGKSQKKKSYVIDPTDHRVVLSVKSNDDGGNYAFNAHHFVSFGLDLFSTTYRKAGFDLHSPVYIPIIDPLVSVVGNTLYTHNAEVLARGLKVMSILIKMPLPEIERSASVIVRQMLSVVNHIGTSQSELSQIALKSLATVIRDCKGVELTEKQLTGLLKMITPDLEDPDRQTTLFALLRGIMSKKFMAPELYDLMDQILRLLVTAQSYQVREICRSIFLQFLLDYPQGKGRLSASLEFLVKNLAYQHESGRQSVLEILNAINLKFTSAIVSKNSDLFVVALVMRVGNESSVKCKEMAIEVLKVIFKRLELGKVGKYLDMLLTWSQNASGPIELRRTALQLIVIYFDVRGSEDQMQLEKVYHTLCATADELAAEFVDQKIESDDEFKSTTSDWQMAYYCLQALSKVYHVATSLASRPDYLNKLSEWNAIQRFLLFPHTWVRTSATRLVGTILSTGLQSETFPYDTANLVSIAQKSILQLRSPQLNDSLALQIVKNLFFILKTLHERFKSATITSSVGFATENSVTKEEIVEASVAKEKDFEDEQCESDEENVENEDPKNSQVNFSRFVSKLSRQASIAHAKRPSIFARDAGEWSIEPASILRIFAALINHLSVDDLDGILRPLMVPMFRIIEDTNTQDVKMQELQNLAKEVQDFLREKVGTAKYSQIYGQLRTVAIEKREARKKLNALKAVNQPELSAKRKISRSESKLRSKKRKQEALSQKNSLFGKKMF